MLVTLIITAIAALFKMSQGKGDDVVSVAIGGLIAAVLIALVVDSMLKKQMHTAVEATDAKMSYVGEGLVVTESWSTGKFYMRKGKARSKLEDFKSQHQG